MIEDAYKKEVEAVEDLKNPTFDESLIPGKTLTEILKNKDESAIFGSFLDKDDEGRALAERLSKNELQPADLQALEAKRVIHIKKMEEVATLESHMTPEYITDFAKSSPQFQNIVNLIGPAKSTEALKKQMRELLVSDSVRFDELSGKLTELIDYRNGGLSKLDDEILEHIRSNGVSEASFVEAMAMEDEKARKVFLADKVHESYGFFKGTADFFTLGKYSKKDAEKLAARKADMDKALAELNNRISGVGEMLENVVDKSDIMREAFSTEIIGEKMPPVEPKTTFMESRKQAPLEEKEIDDKWKNYRKEIKFDKLEPAKQKAEVKKFKNNLIKEEQEKRKKKGFWSRLFGSFFETTVKNKDLK